MVQNGEPDSKTLGDEVLAFAQRKLLISQLEREAKKLRSENHALKSKIERRMQSTGLEQCTVEGGFWAKPELELTAHILEKDRTQAAEWFLKEGLGTMLSGNSRAVASLVKEMIEAGKEVPDFINFSIHETLSTSRSFKGEIPDDIKPTF